MLSSLYMDKATMAIGQLHTTVSLNNPVYFLHIPILFSFNIFHSGMAILLHISLVKNQTFPKPKTFFL